MKQYFSKMHFISARSPLNQSGKPLIQLPFTSAIQKIELTEHDYETHCCNHIDVCHMAASHCPGHSKRQISAHGQYRTIKNLNKKGFIEDRRRQNNDTTDRYGLHGIDHQKHDRQNVFD